MLRENANDYLVNDEFINPTLQNLVGSVSSDFAETGEMLHGPNQNYQYQYPSAVGGEDTFYPGNFDANYPLHNPPDQHIYQSFDYTQLDGSAASATGNQESVIQYGESLSAGRHTYQPYPSAQPELDLSNSRYPSLADYSAINYPSNSENYLNMQYPFNDVSHDYSLIHQEYDLPESLYRITVEGFL